MAISGIFAIQNVYHQQVSNTWPATAYVPPPPGTLYGWFAGGRDNIAPSYTSTVDRIDFSNDTGTSSVRGSLSSSMGYLAATGNENFGWFAGGFPTASKVDRIDYSIDTVVASTRGALSLARYALSGTGNTSYGWFAGGRNTPHFTTIDRIDYSVDTAVSQVRGPLSSAATYGATVGNAESGWIGGGGTGGAGASYIQRVTYSNDTATAPIRSVFDQTIRSQAGSSNLSYGWFSGGVPSSSSIRRLDFSADTVTPLIRGNLVTNSNTTPRSSFDHAATGTTDYGWHAGGRPSGTSRVNRIDYSNDTNTTTERGPLSREPWSLAATGGFPG